MCIPPLLQTHNMYTMRYYTPSFSTLVRWPTVGHAPTGGTHAFISLAFSLHLQFPLYLYPPSDPFPLLLPPPLSPFLR